MTDLLTLQIWDQPRSNNMLVLIRRLAPFKVDDINTAYSGLNKLVSGRKISPDWPQRFERPFRGLRSASGPHTGAVEAVNGAVSE